MNAITGKLARAADEAAACLDDAHLLRSKLIDKCAAVEGAVLAHLSNRSIKISAKAPLSQKMALLRDSLRDKTPLSKADRSLQKAMVELQPLAELRSELAHSTLERAAVNGQVIFLLRNAADEGSSVDRRVVVTPASLRDATSQLSQIANRLRQLAA